MNELDILFKQYGKNIKIFIGRETIEDPNYSKKAVAYLNPLPVRALVKDITFASASYRMPGIKTGQVKELTIEKRHRLLIEKSRKIEISGEIYYGYRPANDTKIQIKEMENYIIVLIATDETE